MTGQPRVPAGQSGGGRFATAECPRMYALLDTLAPAEEPPHAPAEFEGKVPLSAVAVSGRGSWTAVQAPRCPHGRFRCCPRCP